MSMALRTPTKPSGLLFSLFVRPARVRRLKFRLDNIEKDLIAMEETRKLWESEKAAIRAELTFYGELRA